jgi:hypothetical protein
MSHVPRVLARALMMVVLSAGSVLAATALLTASRPSTASAATVYCLTPSGVFETCPHGAVTAPHTVAPHTVAPHTVAPHTAANPQGVNKSTPTAPTRYLRSSGIAVQPLTGISRVMVLGAIAASLLLLVSYRAFQIGRPSRVFRQLDPPLTSK